MQSKTFALKGDIVYSRADMWLACQQGGWLVCENGQVAGVFPTLPEQYEGIPVHAHDGKLIVPGLVDLHVHAPQFAFRGLGMDLELLQWLNTHTFPEEVKYADEDYALRAYRLFVDEMRRGATTRACVFATLHRPATLLLMDLLDASGLVTQVGKVNMDRNGIEGLCEASAAASLQDTRVWLAACDGRYARTQPILTPRFIPSCSDALLYGLGALQKETGLAVQSHLAENVDEIAWVRSLCPEAESYADAYRRFGLLGGEGCPTVMAHCVHLQDDEMELLRSRGVFVAHSPVSNTCLSSGVAPVRAFVRRGLRVGLGTDVAGGFSPSIFRVMVEAIQASKLRHCLVDDTLAPLSVAEAFFLGTRGGGAFFGKVGAFEAGYAFDALVLDDAQLACPFELTPAERLERFVYLGTDNDVAEKYVSGVQLF